MKKWFFEKINKTNKPLVRFIKEKREWAQMYKIRNKKEEVTTDTTEIQRIIKDYYKQLYTNKMDNPEETGKFIGGYNLPRLNQEEIKNRNLSITGTEIEQ